MTRKKIKQKNFALNQTKMGLKEERLLESILAGSMILKEGGRELA